MPISSLEGKKEPPVKDLSSPPIGVHVEYTPAPDRGGWFNNSCPPLNPDTTKCIPNIIYGDDDVDDDDVLDYFLGEWKFELGPKGLIIRKWGINQPSGPGGELYDYFTFEIVTSMFGVETTVVPPGDPT